MRMPSKPTRVRDRKSDTSGTSARAAAKPKGDHAGKVGGRRNAGSDNRKPGTKPNTGSGPRPITHARGQAGYHNR